MAANRLKGVLAHLGASPKPLPTFDELPNFKDFSGCAWGVWGGDDQLGTINLLTDEVVKRAAQEEIRCVHCILRRAFDTPSSDHATSSRSGKSVCLNWYVLDGKSLLILTRIVNQATELSREGTSLRSLNLRTKVEVQC